MEELDAGALLPAIYFIFSRKGCEDAMLQCLRSGLRLTKPRERDEIKRVLAERTADLPDEDLGVLGYHDFAEALSRGIAAHHAGMLAAFKEVVEELFARGLIKVVFATETLALGINMPARTVVLEKLSKWNGEAHVDITPGEYTQLTGRAGRRGIDVEGHAVVLWQPGFDPRAVAGLASTRTYPLRSSFSPSYNMAVNLVRQVGRNRARDMLELRSRSSSPTRPSSGWPARCSATPRRWRGTRSPSTATSAISSSTPTSAGGSAIGSPPARSGASWTGGSRRRSRSRSCGSATSSGSRRAGARAGRWCSIRACDRSARARGRPC